MLCPYCKKIMVESEKKFYEFTNEFAQEYFCFHCYKLYYCTSQSGDMISENLVEMEL